MTAVKRRVKGTKKIVGRTKKDYVITACFYIILALVAAICLFPFLHVLSKSISDEAYVIAVWILSNFIGCRKCLFMGVSRIL